MNQTFKNWLTYSIVFLAGVSITIALFPKNNTPNKSTSRTNDSELTLKNKPVHIYGQKLKVGDALDTDFKLDNPAKVIETQSTQNLSKYNNTWKVVETVPSLDTPVCALQTAQLSVLAKSYKDATFITVSKDLPFAQSKYIASKSLKNVKILSDYRSNFLKTNHLLVKESNLASRAILIVNPQNKIEYVQYAKDETQPLDLNKALNVLPK